MSPVSVRKTYFMLLVGDMDRAVRFYIGVFAATERRTRPGRERRSEQLGIAAADVLLRE